MASRYLYEDIVDVVPFTLWAFINMIRIHFIKAGKNITELLIDNNRYSVNIEKSGKLGLSNGDLVWGDMFTFEVFHVNVPGVCIYKFRFYVIQEHELVIYLPSFDSPYLFDLDLYSQLDELVSDWPYGLNSLAPIAWINKYFNPSK